MHQRVKGEKIIMMGDFNVLKISWDSLQPGIATASGVLIDILFTFNLTQIIREPTQMQGSSCSLLDTIILREHFPPKNTNVEVLEGISDHKTVFETIPARTSVPSHGYTTFMLGFNIANDSCVQTYLAHEFWSFRKVCDCTAFGIDDIWYKFKSTVNHCIAQFVPKKRKVIKKAQPKDNK